MVDGKCPDCGERNPEIIYEDGFLCASCKNFGHSSLRSVIEDMEIAGDDEPVNTEERDWDV